MVSDYLREHIRLCSLCLQLFGQQEAPAAALYRCVNLPWQVILMHIVLYSIVLCTPQLHPDAIHALHGRGTHVSSIEALHAQ